MCCENFLDISAQSGTTCVYQSGKACVEGLSAMQVEEPESASEASTTGKPSAGSSRFAYNMLTEDEAVKAPGVTRGKDGHVSLGNNDFFSNPMGSSVSGRK